MIAQGALKEREVAIAQLVEPLRTALERPKRRCSHSSASGAMPSPACARRSRPSPAARRSCSARPATWSPRCAGPRYAAAGASSRCGALVELAGLSEHCDFTEQVHLVGEEGALRPDLVVHMPDARDLVIDAKTPLDAYLDGARGADRGRRAAWRCAARTAGGDARARTRPPRATGRSSSTAPSSRCCSCPAISSCPPRSPSGRSCWRTPSSRASSSRHPQRSWRCSRRWPMAGASPRSRRMPPRSATSARNCTGAWAPSTPTSGAWGSAWAPRSRRTTPRSVRSSARCCRRRAASTSSA